MKHPVKAPSVGESVTEVSILKWAKNPGDFVKTGDLLLEIESDKATVEVVAETTGQLEVLKAAGDRIPIGEIVATIDDSVKTGASAAPAATAASAAPAPKAPIATSGAMPAGATPGPAARKMLDEVGVAASQVPGTGKEGRPTKGDVMAYMERGAALAAASPSSAATSAAPPAPSPASTSSAPPAASRAPTQIDRPGDRRVKMSMLRQKIAERLVHAQHTAAILTTFNEVDMSAVMALRAKYKDAFKAKYGVGLGFMSFFGRACVEALKQIPAVNGSIDGTDIIYHDYVDLGVAVGTERGLVVPVMRNAEKLGFAGIEGAIADFGARAKVGKLSIQELSGGTFTISNGGTYGSLLSTPILNPPQSGILGMHKIQERPVVVNGKIEVRPMMYLALSYDHRIIDGKEAVTFLVTVKDLLENPEKLGLEFVNELGKL